MERRLAEGDDVAGAVAEATVEVLNRFIADEDNRVRVLRSLTSPNFDSPKALWTARWNDRLTELLRVHLPESHDRDLQASTTATVCLYTAWAAVQQWAAQGLDEPLEPIVTKAFGLAATAARDVQEAMRPERGKG